MSCTEVYTNISNINRANPQNRMCLKVQRTSQKNGRTSEHFEFSFSKKFTIQTLEKTQISSVNRWKKNCEILQSFIEKDCEIHQLIGKNLRNS